MSQTPTKTIAILGATGNQGGSVVSTFLSSPHWHALALGSLGAEIVHADMDSPSSLTSAFASVHAIFAVSDFWGIYSDPSNLSKAEAAGDPLHVWAGKQETEQLKRVIDAAAQVPGLERLVLSSLSDVTKWSGGKYTHVYHFDSKANAEVYGRERYPELWAKTSVLQAGMFLGNYTAGMRPERTANGVVQFSGHLDPNVKLPIIAAEEDTGPLVHTLVHESAGKNLLAYREWLSMQEVVAAFADATGFKAEYVTLSKEQAIPHFPPELQEEIDECLAYINEFGYAGQDPTVVHPKDVSECVMTVCSLDCLLIFD
ncbi:nitrogen metabolic regulation nmr protein [Rutstroemia sp. NJR-2017a BBW]|nr:nitrogen metabolic regulation nmr protein [Rutstroemia sp. NJR-2017a BBW]